MAISLSNLTGSPLRKISVEIADMGGLVEKQLSDAITAFEKRDVALARLVVEKDGEIDALERKIDSMIIGVVENRRLSADTLIEAMSAIKNASDLERIGDLAKNVAKRSVVLSEQPVSSANSSVIRMGRIALRQVSDVLNAVSRQNADAAKAIWGGDQEIDELYNSVFREILLVMSKEPTQVNACTHLVFVAKNFERVGDHATNLAERVYYSVTGARLELSRPKGDMTSFSQVAIEPKP